MTFLKSIPFAAFAAICYLTNCTPPAQELNKAERLKISKSETDQLLSDKSLETYVKVKGKSGFTAVKNRRYPKGIETTYNVLKDKKGRILYIAALPYSETSDWFIAYKSYFDTTGHIFSFQRQNNFMGSQCARGAALESLTIFYYDTFAAVDSSYTLTDSYKKPLDRSTCKFPYNFTYKVFRTVNELKTAEGLNSL